MEDRAVLHGHTGADTNINTGGLLPIAADLRVQGVDTLHNDNLPGLPLQGVSVKDPLTFYKIIARQFYPFPSQELSKLLSEEGPVNPRGLLQIQLILLEQCKLLGLQGRKIVIHLQGMTAQPSILQLPFDQQGCGGLAGAGGTGQKDDGALCGIGRDHIRRLADPSEVLQAIPFHDCHRIRI